jgi:ABC-type bacteriocin/lantibiotic exporter with double-glycine peptidase domain
MKIELKNELSILFNYLKKHKEYAFYGSIFMFLNVLMLLPTPLLTKYLIDNVIPTKNVEKLIIICSVCIIILIFGSLFSILQNYFFW